MSIPQAIRNLLFALTGLTSIPTLAAEPPPTPIEMPADYYAEPPGLPFDEEPIDSGIEAGWHWKEFRYTSYIFEGEPTRVHAVFAIPDTADMVHAVPGIIMTHGVFGAIKAGDWRYWSALTSVVKAGYAVLFFDWYPDYAENAKTGDKKNYTTYGKLNYFTPESWRLRGHDFKESLHYQAMMAGRRGVSWLSSQPGVDANKIGVTGASYGGIFSSLLASIDPRIKAAAPTVYTSGFGLKEEGYNMLPSGWSQQEADAWVNRFDSKVLLAKRNIPVLYTLGANDPTFFVTKGMDIFAAMNQPKHLLLGPNRGHDYWDVDQTILFFDSALKKKMPRPDVAPMQLKQDGRDAIATVKVRGEAPGKVEFALSPLWEIDSDLGAEAIPANVWKWTTVEATRGADGEYSVRYSLPVMRPPSPSVREYWWRTEDTYEPRELRLLKPTPPKPGLLQAFARVTDKWGAVECTPLATPLAFTDPREDVAAKPGVLDESPGLYAAALIKAPGVAVTIDPSVAPGKARATLPVPLASRAVGSRGYILWNWRQQPPAADRKTGEVATPTKQIFPPYKDTIPVTAFDAGQPFSQNAWGGYTLFEIGGVASPLVLGRGWHGSVPVGHGGADEIPIEVTDDQPHRLTLVMAADPIGECNIRITLRSKDGNAIAIRHRLTNKADPVFQFHFKGDSFLKVQVTSQPKLQFNSVIGPSALFLD